MFSKFSSQNGFLYHRIFPVSLCSPSPSLQVLPQKKPISWPIAKTAFPKTQGMMWEVSSTQSYPKI